VFNALDVWQTWLILQFGGHEVNPILNWLISLFGFFPAANSFKSIWLALLGFCIYKKGDKK
jgi:hypothetical protein